MLSVQNGAEQCDGDVYIIGEYSFDRPYMCDKELLLLTQIKALIAAELSDKENVLLF